MATASFQARIERIQKAQVNATPVAPKSVREPGVAAIAASLQPKRRNHPIKDHLISLSLGLVLGCLAAVAQIGLSFEGSPWGPGTELHDLAQYPIMGFLGLAPLLMLLSVFVASKRPGFALFSLGYLSGVVVPIFI